MYIKAVVSANDGGTMPSHAIVNPETFSWKQNGSGSDVPRRLTTKFRVRSWNKNDKYFPSKRLLVENYQKLPNHHFDLGMGYCDI